LLGPLPASRCLEYKLRYFVQVEDLMTNKVNCSKVGSLKVNCSKVGSLKVNCSKVVAIK